jgi:magnesium transporter
MKLVLKEFGVALSLGLLCAVIVIAIVGMTYTNLHLAFVVGATLFTAVAFAALLGTAVPLFFNAADIDPALAAGPLVIILNDLISVALYLGLSTFLLARIS